MHIFSQFLVFFTKIRKICFVHKYDFSKSTNGKNFKIYVQRACCGRSVRIYILIICTFFAKIRKIIFLHRRKFSSAATLQPGSCAEDPSDE